MLSVVGNLWLLSVDASDLMPFVDAIDACV
jgi:hypothetical protein